MCENISTIKRYALGFFLARNNPITKTLDKLHKVSVC